MYNGFTKEEDEMSNRWNPSIVMNLAEVDAVVDRLMDRKTRNGVTQKEIRLAGLESYVRKYVETRWFGVHSRQNGITRKCNTLSERIHLACRANPAPPMPAVYRVSYRWGWDDYGLGHVVALSSDEAINTGWMIYGVNLTEFITSDKFDKRYITTEVVGYGDWDAANRQNLALVSRATEKLSRIESEMESLQLKKNLWSATRIGLVTGYSGE